MKIRWIHISSGQLRFYGPDAMREIAGLVKDDDNYTWTYPPWPHHWIDVFPGSVEAQTELLDVVGESCA
jgi:hypothetical protein